MLTRVFVTLGFTCASLLSAASPLDKRDYPQATKDLIASLPGYWQGFADAVNAFPSSKGTLKQAKVVSAALERIIQPYHDLSDSAGATLTFGTKDQVAQFTQDYADAECKVLAISGPALRKLIKLGNTFSALDPWNSATSTPSNLVYHIAYIFQQIGHYEDGFLNALPYIETGDYLDPSVAVDKKCPGSDTRAFVDARMDYDLRSSPGT